MDGSMLAKAGTGPSPLFQDGGVFMSRTIFIILLYFLGVVLLLYFFMIIPGKKKNRKIRAMHDAIKPGDEIITIGGIEGTVMSRSGDELMIQIDPNGTSLRLLVFAVQSVRTSGTASHE